MADSGRVQDTPEFQEAVQEHLRKLRERLPDYIERAASVPVGGYDSVEWLGRIGKFWWEAREAHGLERNEVAEKMGVDVDQVRFLETGWGGSEELGEEFLRRYAEALGQPELYQQCKERFNLD